MMRPGISALLLLSLACSPGKDRARDSTGDSTPAGPAPAADSTSSPVTYHDLIRVDRPMPGGLVMSPLTVEGVARGTWFSEASFPVMLIDANGDTLVAKPAQAQGEWMTENFVPFKVVLDFTATGDSGFLILRKDNPSGLPEKDDQMRVEVRFRER